MEIVDVGKAQRNDGVAGMRFERGDGDRRNLRAAAEFEQSQIRERRVLHDARGEQAFALRRHHRDAEIRLRAGGGDDMGVGDDQIGTDHEARAGAVKHAPGRIVHDHGDAHGGALRVIDARLLRQSRTGQRQQRRNKQNRRQNP